MKFVRLFACVVVILGTVVAWEHCRDYVFEKLEAKNVEITEDKTTDKSPETTADVKTPVQNAETKVAPEKTATNADQELGLSFEKGFENVAKKAMHSVVNVATMQLIETGGRVDIPDIFRGGPFDDLFKDFFDFPCFLGEWLLSL